MYVVRENSFVSFIGPHFQMILSKVKEVLRTHTRKELHVKFDQFFSQFL